MSKKPSRKRRRPEPLTQVRLSRYAWQVIRAYFDWGADGPCNRNEQLCALGGTREGSVLRIEAAMPLLGASSSACHIAIKAEAWLSAIWGFEDMGLRLLGSAHSHPNMAVFLSGADRAAHTRMFPEGLCVVLNPQHKEIAAFNGSGRKLPLLCANGKDLSYEPQKTDLHRGPGAVGRSPGGPVGLPAYAFANEACGNDNGGSPDEHNGVHPGGYGG